jgi:surfeit locus 1 family protein
MKRIPIFAAAIVAIACAIMIALGIWQLQRAQWKNGLLAEYQAAATLPEMAYPSVPDSKALPLFRQANGFCHEVKSWQSVSGRNKAGAAGWAHLASCGSGAEGPGMVVDVGWSRTPANPIWKGGSVSGLIVPDTKSLIRLVSDVPLAPGLEATSPMSPEDIPNNHFGYAIQWFLFAGVAVLIFGIAAWRRSKT